MLISVSELWVLLPKLDGRPSPSGADVISFRNSPEAQELGRGLTWKEKQQVMATEEPGSLRAIIHAAGSCCSYSS